MVFDKFTCLEFLVIKNGILPNSHALFGWLKFGLVFTSAPTELMSSWPFLRFLGIFPGFWCFETSKKARRKAEVVMPNTDSLKQGHTHDVFLKQIRNTDNWYVGGPLSQTGYWYAYQNGFQMSRLLNAYPQVKNATWGKYKPHTHRNEIKGGFFLLIWNRYTEVVPSLRGGRSTFEFIPS